jgi:hypothetical protein
MQWSSPDATFGALDDPISLKPYAWNRNDPLRYNDVGGRDAIDIFFGPRPTEVGILGRITARAGYGDLDSSRKYATMNEEIAIHGGLQESGIGIGPVISFGVKVVRSPAAMRQLGNVVHHIVPEFLKKFKGAAESRAILQKFNIDVNDAANKMWLQAAKHAPIHTRKYVDQLARALRRAKTEQQARSLLDGIRKAIEKGSWPY